MIITLINEIVNIRTGYNFKPIDFFLIHIITTNQILSSSNCIIEDHQILITVLLETSEIHHTNQIDSK